MRANRLLAPAVATGVLLSGCGGQPQTPEAAASSSAQAARDSEYQWSDAYYPDGTREIKIEYNSYVQSDMVEFCLNATTVGIATLRLDYHAGSSTNSFTDPNACQDERITPEDHLPIPHD